jgi:hypothetical protein
MLLIRAEHFFDNIFSSIREPTHTSADVHRAGSDQGLKSRGGERRSLSTAGEWVARTTWVGILQ